MSTKCPFSCQFKCDKVYICNIVVKNEGTDFGVSVPILRIEPSLPLPSLSLPREKRKRKAEKKEPKKRIK